MMMDIRNIKWAISLLILCLCMTSSAFAADVQSSVSTRETYVNLPFTLQIQINNADSNDKPMIPAVDGLEIVPQGPPSRSFRTTIINGRTSQRNTLTYLYSVTATREGTFTIPPATVIVNGQETRTQEVRIIATQSETDDLLFVEIEGKDDQIYVGEALQLTLKIWVRAYRDREFNLTLNEATMWSLISKQTKWGNFQESLAEMAKNRQVPKGKLTLRKDMKGQEREYLLYEINATVYPDRPGKIDGDDVRIILNYPEKLGRTRSPFSAFGDDFFSGASGFGSDLFSNFGSQIAITSVRPIIAETEVETITVKPVPEQGRPQNYRGAVGVYRIASEAAPRAVKVGDPITLNIGIAGEGPMDLLRAPPLAEQQNLIQDFKVPNQPLAGFVDGPQKVFSTTIRPLKTGTFEIPGIEYSFFNPKTEQFVSIQSDPIPIEVEAAELLALDAIVGNQTSIPGTSPMGPTAGVPATPAAAELSSNMLVKADRPRSISLSILVMLLVPPLAVGIVGCYRNRSRFSGLLSARRRFSNAISKATTPQQVALGLEQFLQRHYRLSDGRALQDQTVGALRASGFHELAIDAERLYHQCLGNDDTSSTDRWKTAATELVGRLAIEKTNRSAHQRVMATHSGYRKAKSAFILLAMLTVPLSASLSLASETEKAATSPETGKTEQAPAARMSLGDKVDSAPSEDQPLSKSQIGRLFQEASTLYSEAMLSSEQQASSESFSEAAKRLQLLVDAGITNDDLFATLANAQARTGKSAEAIANYRRALRYSPDNQSHRDRLAETEAAAGISYEVAGSPINRVRRYNDFVLHFVSPSVMLLVAFIAWLCAWGFAGWRLMSGPQPWKLPATCLMLLAVTTFCSYQLRISEFSRDKQAVVTQSEIPLRKGDGTEFELVQDTPVPAGKLVQILDHRGFWHKVQLANGQSGWLPSAALELI